MAATQLYNCTVAEAMETVKTLLKTMKDEGDL